MTPRESFSLDATTFTQGSTRYLCWAQSDPELGSGTSLYLAAMTNPWTITGTPVRISKPTLAWETIGHNVNEGPAVITRNGRIFMTFSASATDANYAVGLLTASSGANLLNASSWTKHAQPVLRSNDATSQYGPGHNSFTVSEDGQSDILVYHARPYKAISGDPLYDPNRHTRIQKVYWRADGTPDFGIPVAAGATPYRLALYGQAGSYLHHYDFRVRASAAVAMLADSQFRIVPGLAGGSARSRWSRRTSRAAICGTRTTRCGSRPTTAPRSSTATRASISATGSPTPPRSRSSRTTRRAGSCAAPAVWPTFRPSPPLRTAPTRPSGSPDGFGPGGLVRFAHS